MGGYFSALKSLETVLGGDQIKARAILNQNPKRLIQWREKKVEVVIEGPKWKCHFCGKTILVPECRVPFV